MNEIKKELWQMHAELKASLELVSDYSGALLADESNSSHHLQIKETESLLERCREIVSEREDKPPLRVIHHFACTGGTLISKCLASMPNTYLLSEVHPCTPMFPPAGQAKFLPTDLISQLVYAKIPSSRALSYDLFRDNIMQIYNHLIKYGGDLVVRDHSHSDYCHGSVIRRNQLKNTLKKIFTINSIATIRNPLESYSSLIRNGWLTFQPNTFDEYCKRYLQFLKDNSNVPLFKYEDFVRDPITQARNMCEALNINFDRNFIDLFTLQNMSGDSGRGGNIISKRDKEIESEVLLSAKKSKYFQELIQRCNYKIKI